MSDRYSMRLYEVGFDKSVRGRASFWDQCLISQKRPRPVLGICEQYLFFFFTSQRPN